ncbi:MAG: peptidoglycan DD-metalloendopeptidase family protein [Kineosporiaceae bacterium]
MTVAAAAGAVAVGALALLGWSVTAHPDAPPAAGTGTGTATVTVRSTGPEPGLPAVESARDRRAGGRPRWTPPLPGARPVRRFDVGPLPWSPGHRGVDLEAASPGPGSAVVSPAAGRVSFAGPVGGVDVVVITHAGGLRSTVMPVRARVPVGTTVSSGQVVGVVSAGRPPGHLACPTGLACLHWGVLRGEVYLDPWSLLVPRVVRLVPYG